MGLTLEEIDLADPGLYASGDPHAVWRTLRREAPVFWNRQRHGPGFWVVTRYDDIRRVSRDPRTFISSGGTSTQDLERGDTASLDYKLMQGTLVITDPPRHTKLRALVNKTFTPQAVARLEPFIREAVVGLIDEVAPRGACDVVADLSARLPFTVICELLGIPEADRRPLFVSLKPMMASRVELLPGEPESALAGAMALVDYLTAMVEERSLRPREDLLSGMVGVEIEGERLTRADMLAMSILLFIAGSETTMNAISGGVLTFVENPAERARLDADPSLWPTAVEEILRWTSPTMVSMVRTATRDAEIRGTPVATGQKVTLWYGSANRDEEAFADPDRFDVGRTPNEHLAFGFGAHFCLGASLAQLEIRVMFEEMFARLPDVALAGPVVRLRSNIFAGFESIPVRFRAA